MFKKKHATPAVTLKETWKDGDAVTKLSFFIMGLNAIKHRQWVKGFSLLFAEIVFFSLVLFKWNSFNCWIKELRCNKE